MGALLKMDVKIKNALKHMFNLNKKANSDQKAGLRKEKRGRF